MCLKKVEPVEFLNGFKHASSIVVSCFSHNSLVEKQLMDD